jgi:glycosyltransferase involved in cell wall biosynthesis
MKVLALAPYPEGSASTRYRIGQFVPALAARGVEVTIAPMLDGRAFDRLYRPGGLVRKGLDWFAAAGRRSAQIERARAFDAVFVLRDVWPLRLPPFEHRLLERTPRVVFDFDDAIFLPHVSDANKAFGFLKAHDKATWLTERARAVTPGNAFLARWAEARKAPDARVFEVPTAVDTERWRPPTSRAARVDAPVRLGWIGSHSTAPYLEALAPVIERLRARHPGLRLSVIGATTTRFPVGMVDHVPWALEDEVSALSQVDIGLAPLPDTDWSRGKCGLKLIQYLALAIPAVASPVGVHPEMIEDGAQGFLAADDAAWERALGRLIEDAALRRTLGEAGRARVEERYSLRAVAPRLLEALRFAGEVA